MSWLNRIFRKDDGEEPARAQAPPAVHPRQPGKQPARQPVRPKGEPGSGYGANPYDTYTWELHTDDDGERQLKRAHVVDRKKDKDAETFNPYDTGKFSGGW
ncbi:MAG: hypothetical protein OEW88_02960 [Gammaproteobacteria bacterium]|nr:hypothetical protein [Gammaproteobacteria bacterium]MDH5275359.1 hypothetical protein [Gammaproteobacteria bacterium]